MNYRLICLIILSIVTISCINNTTTVNNKIPEKVNFYLEHLESLSTIGKRRGKNWKLLPKARDMLGMNVKEGKDFEKLLNKGLKEKGVIKEWNLKKWNFSFYCLS